MNKRPIPHRLEFPLLIAYILLWLAISIFARIEIEMQSDRSPKNILIWAAAISFPIVMYASKRTGDIEKVKWYGYIGYFFSYILVFVYITQSMISQSGLLISAARQQETMSQADLIEVRKVFKRKIGFDHTEVKLTVDGKQMVLKARPYAYFYLQGKKQIEISYGNSGSGPYVSSSNVTNHEMLIARWEHLQDQFHRNRMVAFFLIPVAIGLWLALRYFPDPKKATLNKANTWKILGLCLLAIIVFFLIAYIALWLYASTS